MPYGIELMPMAGDGGASPEFQQLVSETIAREMYNPDDRVPMILSQVPVTAQR